MSATPHKHEVRGLELTLREISERYQLPLTTLKARVRDNKEGEELVAEIQNERHGMAGTAVFDIWINIKQRCFNPKNSDYVKYGARGISMSPVFYKSFTAFYEHVGERPSKHHSVDRIDNNRGYEEGNLRWATRKQQSNNTRRTIKGTFDGEELSGVQACEKYNLQYSTVMNFNRKHPELSFEEVVEIYKQRREEE